MPSWRRDLASVPIRSANGAIASSPIGSRASTTRCVAADPSRLRMKRRTRWTARDKLRVRYQASLAFLRHIGASVPGQLDVHRVVGNYAMHKHRKVRAWLARRPRWHIHFTSPYASWLNQFEPFFALITQRAIRRGSFESTADLVKKIDRFIRTHNANSQPFVWTATADSILQKLARLCQRISGTEH